jgi:type IV pilus assembly protein PilA
MVIITAVLLIAPWILLPIYANAIYWRHIRKLIDGLPQSIATVPDKRQARLERNGGTGAGALVAVLVGGVLIFIFIGGILAAIAIPAYQDYTLRAQVTEGLNLAGPVKAEVAEYYAGHQAWPEQADFGAEMPSGKYVKSVSVASGSVVITYGNQANPRLNGQRLALQPGVTSQGDITWACGNAAMPEGVTPAGGPSGTDLAPKYLPKACRENQP